MNRHDVPKGGLGLEDINGLPSRTEANCRIYMSTRHPSIRPLGLSSSHSAGCYADLATQTGRLDTLSVLAGAQRHERD